MKKVISLLSVCAVLLGMAACSNDVFEDEFIDKSSDAQTRAAAVAPETSTLAYIMSEGDWYSKVMGSISKFDPSTQTITTGYFKTVNGVDLGDTGNEMVLYNGKIYCLVSGHDLTSNNGGLWVIDPATCQATTKTMIQYDDPKQTGYKAMPRHMAFDDGKIYISLYSGAVISVNIDEPQTVVGKKILPAKFSEGICVVANKVYVCNSGKENDTMAGEGNTISYFATNSMDGTSQNVSTMTSALNPKLIKYSENTGCFYYNALGQGAMNTSLHYFTDATKGYSTISGAKASDFDLTDSDIYTVDVDWDEYETNMSRISLATNEVDKYKFDNETPSFFGLSVKYHNGRLYVGESMAPRMFVFEEDIKETTENTPIVLKYLYNANTGVSNINTVVFVD